MGPLSELTKLSCEGQVLTTMFAMLMGAMGLGMATPSFGAIGKAQALAARIYHIIDRVPEIDVYSEAGFKPDGPAQVVYTVSYSTYT